MTCEAAIIHGPRGRFGVIRVKPGEDEPTWTEEQRTLLQQCFWSKHGRMPVVFLSSVGGQFDLISDEPIEALDECIAQVDARQWYQLENKVRPEIGA